MVSRETDTRNDCQTESAIWDFYRTLVNHRRGRRSLTCTLYQARLVYCSIQLVLSDPFDEEVLLLSSLGVPLWWRRRLETETDTYFTVKLGIVGGTTVLSPVPQTYLRGDSGGHSHGTSGPQRRVSEERSVFVR